MKREKKFLISIVLFDFVLWNSSGNVFLMEIFIPNKNHRLLGNLLVFLKQKSWFHLAPKNRKPETWYKIKCDVGASKNAGQAFSTPRLSSHFILYQVSGFRFLSPSNQDLKFSSFYHNTDSDCKYYQWNHKYSHNQCCFLVKCRYDCILCF